MIQYISIHTTVSDSSNPFDFMQALLQDGLAACIQLSEPITSSYQWDSVIESTKERQLTIKTIREYYPIIHDRITDWHSYEIPQIYTTEWLDVSPTYRDWVNEQLRYPSTDKSSGV